MENKGYTSFYEWKMTWIHPWKTRSKKTSVVTNNRKLIQRTRKKVAKKIDCTAMINCWITGLPWCLNWIEYPIHQKSLSIFTWIIEKELLNEPLYITQVDKSGMVQSQLHLKRNPSGWYNINYAQCQYSRGWLLGMMKILDNISRYNISKDCPNYFLLFEFFNNIDVDERLATGMELLTYEGQKPSENYI